MTTINRAYSFLKFLDQPQLIGRLEKYVPIALPLTGAAYVAYDSLNAPQQERQKRFLKGAIGMATTIGFALGAFVYFKEGHGHEGQTSLKNALEALKKSGASLSKSVQGLIQKSKSQVLSPGQVHTLQNTLLGYGKPGEEVFNEIVPLPHNHSAREILGEIGRLSMLGAAPVVGGILGGVLGNKAVGDDWRRGLKNQSKEGLYQFLANIFLCNIGAGAALYLQEKASIPFLQTRPARLAAMSVGIFVAGIYGGNASANFIGQNFFNPLCDKGISGMVDHVKNKVKHQGWGSLFKNLNAERHAELIDIGIHADDMATVGVMAGFKWIEASLPFLYTLCGYRTMIGYRNGKPPLLEMNKAHQNLATGSEQRFNFRGFQQAQAPRAQFAQYNAGNSRSF